MKAGGLAALARDEQKVVAAARVCHLDQFITLAHLDGDDPIGLEIRVVGLQSGLLDDAVPRSERSARSQ